MSSAFSSTGSENMSKLASEICSLIACDVSCNHNHKRHSSTPFIDWFRLLGVEEDADGDAIRKRYHSLALLLHPDKNKDHQAETAFKLVLEAYSCLTDKAKRSAFLVERSKNFCIDSQKIPSRSSKRWAYVRENRQQNYSFEIRERVREEARVVENCLRRDRTKMKKESPVFDPAEYKHVGYPHVRSPVVTARPGEYANFRKNNKMHSTKGRRSSEFPVFGNKVEKQTLRPKTMFIRA